MRQIQFQKIHWQHRFAHGGTLRQKRKGRQERPLSTKDPIHLVFKANRETIAGGFRTARRFVLIDHLIRHYANRFFVKIEQISIQGDHIHIVARLARRSAFQNFLRVASGQIAQRLKQRGLMSQVTDTPKDKSRARKLWKFRPFTRVVSGYRAYLTVQAYVRLNEMEARGGIPYRKSRLKGLSHEEWEKLWT